MSVNPEVTGCPFDLCWDRTFETFDPVLDDIRVTIGRRIHSSAEDSASVDEVIVIVAALLPVTLEHHLLEPLHRAGIFERNALTLFNHPVESMCAEWIGEKILACPSKMGSSGRDPLRGPHNSPKSISDTFRICFRRESTDCKRLVSFSGKVH